MKNFIPVFMHTLELTIVIGVAILIQHFFNLDAAGGTLLVSTVLGAFVKYARVSDLPIPDYVNKLENKPKEKFDESKSP